MKLVCDRPVFGICWRSGNPSLQFIKIWVAIKWDHRWIVHYTHKQTDVFLFFWSHLAAKRKLRPIIVLKRLGLQSSQLSKRIFKKEIYPAPDWSWANKWAPHNCRRGMINLRIGATFVFEVTRVTCILFPSESIIRRYTTPAYRRTGKFHQHEKFTSFTSRQLKGSTKGIILLLLTALCSYCVCSSS